MSYSITVNGAVHEVDVDGDTPLLWVIRDTLGLTGTKFGCGIAECGACTVHVDGEAMQSCQIAVEDAVGMNITTIEGLLGDQRFQALQEAWIAEQAPQCGYCQSGMLMAAATLLANNPTPSDDDIADAMINICRCGTYNRVHAAIRRAAAA